MSAAYCEACGVEGNLSLEDLMSGDANCSACGGLMVLMAEGEGDETIAPPGPPAGDSAGDLPPLPSWDGSETREVEDGGRVDELQAAAQALLRPASLLEEVETIELRPGESSSGRVSRSYDADQLDQTTKDWDVGASQEPDDKTRSWQRESPEALGEATRSWEVVEAEAEAAEAADRDVEVQRARPTRSLFDFTGDPDWDALLDESLPELEEDDPDARRNIIRVPESAAARAETATVLEDLLRPFGISSPEEGLQQQPVTQRWKVEPRTQTFHVFDRAQSPEPQEHVKTLNFRDVDPAICTVRYPNSDRAGRFSSLATRVGGARAILVTSATRGEGRTSVALNLAVTAASVPGQEAILIEVDLDGGSATSMLGVPSADLGLLSLLKEQSDPRAALIKFSLGEFHLLPRGRGGDRSHIPERLGDLLVELRGHYPRALLVVDGPPVREGSARLASRVDGALLVVRRGRVSRDEVAEAVAALGRGRILGAVFNEG
ncbi:MAG: CpsD/CapB family tyrosine-protein kinase [Planctomycetes bacterium]|nr:CpsD/CapB family tyrosine-protein kinase [Planctomycetota bacterium]